MDYIGIIWDYVGIIQRLYREYIGLVQGSYRDSWGFYSDYTWSIPSYPYTLRPIT